MTQARSTKARRPLPARWNKARRASFLDALASKGCVIRAAEAVGMGARGAYKLRIAEAGFAEGWAQAIEIFLASVEAAVLIRARDGVEALGEGRTPSASGDRAAIALLKARKPAKWAEIERTAMQARSKSDLGRSARERLMAMADEAEARQRAAQGTSLVEGTFRVIEDSARTLPYWDASPGQ